MKVIVTSETMDLIVFVGLIFALCALACVVYWEVQRRRQRRRQMRRSGPEGRKKRKAR